jgi:hypothetical protein
MRQISIILILVLISSSSCRKFRWDNPYDTNIPSTEPASLKNGLIAYYPFNGNANDESGNGNNGTAFSTIPTTDRFSRINSAFSFDGVQSYVEAPIEFKSYSISIWYNTPILKSTFNTLFTYNNTYAQLTLDGIVYARYQYPTPPSLSGITNYISSFNKWNNLIVIFDANSKTLDIYVNGVNNFRAIESGDGIFNISWENNIIYLGMFFNRSSYFNGKIDDVRIYNRALTQEEITYLANN